MLTTYNLLPTLKSEALGYKKGSFAKTPLAL